MILIFEFPKTTQFAETIIIEKRNNFKHSSIFTTLLTIGKNSFPIFLHNYMVILFNLINQVPMLIIFNVIQLIICIAFRVASIESSQRSSALGPLLLRSDATIGVTYLRLAYFGCHRASLILILTSALAGCAPRSIYKTRGFVNCSCHNLYTTELYGWQLLV